MPQIGIAEVQDSRRLGQRRFRITVEWDSGGLGWRRLGQRRFRMPQIGIAEVQDSRRLGQWRFRIAVDWDSGGLGQPQIGIPEVQDSRRLGQQRFRMAQIGIAKVQDAVDWDSTGFIGYWWIGIAEDRWIVIAESICAEWIDQRSLLNI